jgi:hypothetical protein
MILHHTFSAHPERKRDMTRMKGGWGISNDKIATQHSLEGQRKSLTITGFMDVTYYVFEV